MRALVIARGRLARDSLGNLFRRMAVPTNGHTLASTAPKLKPESEATKFRKGWSPKESVDYEWVWDFAKEKYQGLVETFKYLDSKAEVWLKFLVGSSGVAAIIALANLTRENAALLLVGMAVVGLPLLRTVYLLYSAHKLADSPTPPSVEAAICYAEKYEAARATFLGQMHETCEGMRSANAKKGRILEKASWWLWVTLICSVVFVAGAGIWKVCGESSPKPAIVVTHQKNGDVRFEIGK
jgi:hypothetical protein